MNYYYLTASLPPIELGKELDISFSELMTRFEMNLTDEDKEKVTLVRRVIDLANILRLLKKESCDPRGNFTTKELEEALLNKVGLSERIFDFFERYTEVKDQIANFYGLFEQFFSEEVEKQKGYLKKYLQFERCWRLSLLGYRAKKLGWDLTHELQHEDFTDPLVAEILAQKDAPTYEFPFDFRELGERLRGATEPLEQNRVIATYRLEKAEELCDSPIFSIEWLLSYMIKLIILEDLAALDPKKGFDARQRMTS